MNELLPLGNGVNSQWVCALGVWVGGCGVSHNEIEKLGGARPDSGRTHLTNTFYFFSNFIKISEENNPVELLKPEGTSV